MSDDLEIGHRHEYALRRIVDGCHFTEEVRACRCGARHSARYPRDFTDGTQRAYASQDCEVCQTKLQTLPSPAHWGEKL